MSSGAFSQCELVRMVECCNVGDAMVEEDGGGAWSISRVGVPTNGLGNTALHVACENRHGAVALSMLRRENAR